MTESRDELQIELNKLKRAHQSLRIDLEQANKNHAKLGIYRGVFQNLIFGCKSSIDSNGSTNKKCIENGSYTFIPRESDNIIYILQFLKEHIEKNKCLPSSTKFLDAGCGIGNILMIAYAMGFHNCAGLEFDDETVKIAKLLTRRQNRNWASIMKRDIITFKTYKDYDVIYFYRPLSDHNKQIKFEQHLYNTMKVGAIVIPLYRGYIKLNSDKRFKPINKSRHMADIFVKVKEGNKPLTLKQWGN